jgi:hypothetical protein
VDRLPDDTGDYIYKRWAARIPMVRLETTPELLGRELRVMSRVGQSWAFRDHRTIKEVMADEAKRPAG